MAQASRDILQEPAQGILGEGDDFLATLAHEIRSPLHTILALAEMGRAQGQSWTHSTHQKNFAIIMSSAQRLLQLTENLMGLSRTSALYSPDSFTFCALDDLLECAIENVQGMAHKKHISFSIRGDEIALHTECSEMGLQQVFTNILSNAIRYSPNGSIIDIEFSQKPNNHYVIRFHDQGPGIGAHEMKHIFDTFYQGSNCNSHHGLGLGLALSQRIIEQHGGSLFASNSPAGGAILTVELPSKAPNHQTYA